MTKQAWNKNRSVGQKKPFTIRQVEMLKEILGNSNKTRELALLSFGIDSMLRASDLLKIKVEEVLDITGQVRTKINIKQKKTGAAHIVMISATTAKAVDNLIRKDRKLEQDYLFTGYKMNGKPKISQLCRTSYADLVKDWCKLLRLDFRDYSTHSIRRTMATVVYGKTNNIEVVRQLLGQKSVGATSAYLNLDKEKALDVYSQFLT